MSFFAALIAAALMSPAAAPSADNIATAPSAASAATERKICKRDPATESRLRAKRVCKTQAEWRQHSREIDVSKDLRDPR